MIDNLQPAGFVYNAMVAKPILIAWHSRTGAAEALAKAVNRGAQGSAVLVRAKDVQPEHIIAAKAYVFACPENLASMSGEMKEMFDRCYYPVLGQVEGTSYATIVAAGSDGEGAQRQMDRIATGWRLRRITDPMIFNFQAQTEQEILAIKTVPQNYLIACEQLGNGLKEGLEIGLY
ncbi:MAG: NAD(P)H-dependent oxidoreductase [Erythrobacter sp.]